MAHRDDSREPTKDPDLTPVGADHLRLDDLDRPATVRGVDPSTGEPANYLAFNRAFFTRYGMTEVPESPNEIVGQTAPEIDAADREVIATRRTVELEVRRFDTLISLSKQPIIRGGRVVAILTVNDDLTDLATAKSQAELLSLAMHTIEERLLLYRIESGERVLVFANRAATVFNARLASSTEPLEKHAAILLEETLDLVVQSKTRLDTRVDLNDESCVVHDQPLVDRDGTVTGVARTISDITPTIRADWTGQLLEIATLTDTKEAVERAFVVGRALLDLPIAVLAQLVGDEIVVHGTSGPGNLAERLPSHHDFVNTLERGQVILARDLRRLNATGTLVVGLGLRTIAAIPITVDGVKWGLLAFGGTEPREERFPDRTVPLLEALGGTLSHMLERDAARKKLVPVELLRRSNRELEEYAYAAAHDLRSPLRSMSSFSQLLKQQLGTEPIDAERLFGYADRIINGAEQMTKLLSSMLDHAKAGTSTGGQQIVDVAWLVDEIIGSIESDLLDLDGVVTVGPLPTIAFDAGQFQRVMHNLIDNALKYRHPDRPPRIEVSSDIDSDQDHVIIDVADNGVGIPAEYHDQVFVLFKRLSVDGDGTGVGLSVVRRIIEENGGSIEIDSPQSGGTVFRIRLPRTRLVPPD